MIVQVLEHLEIIGAGGMAAIQQLHQQGVVALGLKVAVDEVIPALTVRIAYFGVAIAGQVHKIAAVHLIKVDGSRFARRGRNAGQVFAAAQLVDEAGFAHVGAAGETDLRAVTVGQLAGNTIAGHKIRFVVIHKSFPFLSADGTGLGLFCSLGHGG